MNMNRWGEFAIGDTVEDARGRVYTVLASLRVNVQVKDETGKVWRGKPGAFRRTDKEMPVPMVGPSGKPVVYRLGTLVRCTIAARECNEPDDTIWVVIRMKDDVLNIVPLGGMTKYRYYRCSKASTVIVDVASLTKGL